MQQKLESVQQENAEYSENVDADEMNEQTMSCSLCFGEIEEADRISIAECGHNFHVQCIYQSFQADIGIYKRVPVCGVCDADGQSVVIPVEVCRGIIQTNQDPDMLAEYEEIVASN